MREVGRVIEELGFCYSMEICRKHIKVRMRDGTRERMMVISVTPSDKKALLNVKSVVRRVMA